jgi:hypothetical protein
MSEGDKSSRGTSFAQRGGSERARARQESAMKELIKNVYTKEEGAIGYIALWFLGVPASVLFVIFLLRGCT